ncbi:hypothetical protein GCM10028812_53370 [Ancylobacter sonchi]
MPRLFLDIIRALPGWDPTRIFDVGANSGQSASSYAIAFPEALIHSFEPVPETYGGSPER